MSVVGADLAADTGVIRTGAAVAASYVGTLQDAASRIRWSINSIDNAVMASATAAVWLHVGLRCADGTDGEAHNVNQLSAGLVQAASLLEETDDRLARDVPEPTR